MPSYVIVGATRGIGLEFVRQLSQDTENIVFGTFRSPQSSTKLLELRKSNSNVHLLQADLDDADSLKAAAEDVAKVTGGTLDVLINSGAYLEDEYSNRKITEFPDANALGDKLTAAFRTNVVGVANATNTFLPLLRAGQTKKVISLSTGFAAVDVVLGTSWPFNPQYKISKAALNMLVAEFAVSLRSEGFTFVALSPGFVNTAQKPPTPEDIEAFKAIVASFKKYQPSWDGIPLTPETSVRLMREVIAKLGPKDSGAFLSHHGNQVWL